MSALSRKGPRARAPFGWEAFGECLLSDVLEVEHLFGAGHDDDLAASVLLPSIGYVVGRDRIGRAEARGAPARFWQSALFWVDQVDEYLPCAHERQAPVVVKGSAAQFDVVRVAGHLVVAASKAGVVVDDLGKPVQNLFALGLEAILARSKQHIAGQGDEHPVVADGDLQPQVRQGSQLFAQQFKAAFDPFQGCGAPLVFRKGLLALLEGGVQVGYLRLPGGEVGVELVHVDSELFEARLEGAHLVNCRFELPVDAGEFLAALFVFTVQASVLGELGLPLLLGIAATGRKQNEQKKSHSALKRQIYHHNQNR